MTVGSGITVAILAGGISRRLGRDKAAEPFGHETLLRRVVRRASEAVGSNDVAIVVSNIGQLDRAPADIFHRLAVDAFPGYGTLGGSTRGLRQRATHGRWWWRATCPSCRTSVGIHGGAARRCRCRGAGHRRTPRAHPRAVLASVHPGYFGAAASRPSESVGICGSGTSPLC